MPTWTDVEQFLVTGLSLGGVYALSGVGMLVLYRATGVLNLAFGAIGVFAALIAWQLINHSGLELLAGVPGVRPVGGVVDARLRDGVRPGARASRPVGQGDGNAGPGTDPARVHGSAVAVERRRLARAHGSDRQRTFQVGEISVTYTDVLALVLGLVVTVVAAVFLRFAKLGTAMRAMANDLEITASLGVPVRRVDGGRLVRLRCLAGMAGVLLSDLVALDSTTLTFLVISTLAAALVGRLARSRSRSPPRS